jgi:solute carrier family 39 (zinc transporter), member 1/2/3
VSLTTAILFHQLFEGLSLGIRIASLPRKEVDCDIAVDDEEDLRRRFASSLQPASYVPSPIIPGLDSDPGASSNPTLPPRHDPTTDNIDSQMIGRGQSSREREVHWLKPTLSVLFAVTTPFGMCAGMILWKGGTDTSLFLLSPTYIAKNLIFYTLYIAQMLLIKGTMSAISAGMLIYAATVEMIAGDFVFGDVDGGHGHGHHDLHQRSSDSSLGNDDDNDNEPLTSDDGKHLEEQLKKGATTMKKALAVLSLFAGVVGMVIIG